MPLSRAAQLAFWQTVAHDLSRGGALIPTLEHVQQEVAETALGTVADELVRALREGVPLSAAMADSPWTFSQCECAMIRAGEATAALDAITQRIVEGIQDDSLPLPGFDGRAEDQPVRYWRALGRLLAAGVPLLEALRLVALEVAGPRLGEATRGLRQAILDDGGLAPALRNYPDLFPEPICRAIEAAEQDGQLAAQALRIADAIASDRLAALLPEAAEAAAGVEEATVAAVAFVAQLIRTAAEQHASDIHLEPTEDGRGRVRLRLDGALHELDAPPEGLFPHVVREIKASAHLDPDESRLPQEGRIALRLADRPLDLRVGVAPTVHGERVVLRVLDRADARFDLDRIEFLPDDLATVRRLCQLPSGLVVVNGPAGSGKTTLLYALLHTVDHARRSVLTVEDPVEYTIEGVAQVQAEPKKGLPVAQAIQSVLRQDPDVLMVGEIPDLEVATLCVQAALTGHLVLTTLNANTSPGAIRRLLDLGVEPFLLNAALAAVISQRLIRVLCPQCKQEAEPAPHSLPPEAAELIERTGRRTFPAPRGCPACHGTGYRGRTAIHEILLPTDRVRHAIATRADVESLRNAALAGGLRPLLACGFEKAARGLTSLAEVCRVVPPGAEESAAP